MQYAYFHHVHAAGAQVLNIWQKFEKYKHWRSITSIFFLNFLADSANTFSFYEVFCEQHHT